MTSLWSPEEAKSAAWQFFLKARGFREAGSEVQPAVLLLVTDGEKKQVLQVLDVNLEYTRSIANSVGAQFVIFINEGYEISNKEVPKEELVKIQRVSAHPLRREILFCHVDGPGLALRLVAQINPDGTLGETDEQSLEGAEGSLTNLSGRLGEN